MSKDGAMQTISRAVKILKAFSIEEQELTLADLHRKLNISKSSLQRILNTLVAHRLIEKDNKHKTYRLGIELYFLGQLVEKNRNLLTVSRPHMEALNEKYDEAITLNIIDGEERKCIGFIPSKQVLTMIGYVGHTSPLHAGASAKLLLAYLPDEEKDALLDKIKLERLTSQTIVNREELNKEIQRIREVGYAISYSERTDGVFSVSAPIRDRFDEVIAGVSITIPMARFDEDKVDMYIEDVKKTAEKITRDLS